MATEVERASKDDPSICYLGRVSKPEVYQYLQEAACLIFPSSWYEHFPMVILEAYAVGTPVIAFNLGSTGEIVIPGRTGYLVPAEDTKALAEVIERVFHEPGN